MAPRRLVSTRRSVAMGRLAEYDRAWEELRISAGAETRAWRYRSADGTTEFIEFIEFAGGGDPRGRNEFAECLRMLDAIAPGAFDDWVDASLIVDTDKP